MGFRFLLHNESDSSKHLDQRMTQLWDDVIEALRWFAMHHPDPEGKVRPCYANNAQMRSNTASSEDPFRNQAEPSVLRNQGELKFIIIGFDRNDHVPIECQRVTWNRYQGKRQTQRQSKTNADQAEPLPAGGNSSPARGRFLDSGEVSGVIHNDERRGVEYAASERCGKYQRLCIQANVLTVASCGTRNGKPRYSLQMYDYPGARWGSGGNAKRARTGSKIHRGF